MSPTTGTATDDATESATEAATEADMVSEAVDAQGTGRPGILARMAGWLSPVRVVLTLVVLALAASTAYFGYQWHQQGQAEQRANAERATVLADGRTYAIALSSYGYQDLGANFKAVTANATGSFAKQYKLVSSDLAQLIAKYRATSKASVRAEAVQSLNGNEAVLLLFVDQHITNTRIKSPQVDSNRMRMTLVRSGGRWLLDNVQLQ